MPRCKMSSLYSMDDHFAQFFHLKYGNKRLCIPIKILPLDYWCCHSGLLCGTRCTLLRFWHCCNRGFAFVFCGRAEVPKHLLNWHFLLIIKFNDIRNSSLLVLARHNDWIRWLINKSLRLLTLPLSQFALWSFLCMSRKNRGTMHRASGNNKVWLSVKDTSFLHDWL